MSRTKGKDKGCGNPDHGSARTDVSQFLDRVRRIPAYRRLAMGAEKDGHESAPRIAQETRALEIVVLDSFLSAIARRDAKFFYDIARRIESADLGSAVDPVAEEIVGIWEMVKQVGLWEETLAHGGSFNDFTPRESIPFPILLKKLERAFPKKKFSTVWLRRKAKDLGVCFGAAGRPKKSKLF